MASTSMGTTWSLEFEEEGEGVESVEEEGWVRLAKGKDDEGLTESRDILWSSLSISMQVLA